MTWDQFYDWLFKRHDYQCPLLFGRRLYVLTFHAMWFDAVLWLLVILSLGIR